MMGGMGAQRGQAAIRIVVGLLVGAVFMALAFRGVPLRDFTDAFGRLQPGPLFLIAILFFLQEIVRAYRQLVLMRPIAPRMRFSSSLSIFFISYLFIHLFPARLGELVRPYLLAKREEVPLSACTGMVVAERAVDGLAATLMFLALLLLVPLPEHLVVGEHSFHIESMARTAGFLLATPTITLILVMTLLPDLIPSLLDKILHLLTQRLNMRWMNRRVALIGDVTRAFARGFHGLRNSGSLAMVLVLTVLGWTITATMYWLMAIAFGIDALVGPGEAFAVMVITLWASVLPAPPGMAGVQEAFGRGALALFGVSGPALAPVGLAYAVLIHWGQVLLQALGAWYFLIRDGLPLKSLFRLPAHANSDTSADL